MNPAKKPLAQYMHLGLRFQPHNTHGNILTRLAHSFRVPQNLGKDKESQMAARLQIGLRDGLMDAEGANIKRKAKDYFGFEIEDIRVIRALTIDADLDEPQLEMLRTHIFTNPVTEASSFSPMAKGFDWVIWIGFRPGVRDTAGSTAEEAIEDLIRKYKKKKK